MSRTRDILIPSKEGDETEDERRMTASYRRLLENKRALKRKRENDGSEHHESQDDESQEDGSQEEGSSGDGSGKEGPKENRSRENEVDIVEEVINCDPKDNSLLVNFKNHIASKLQGHEDTRRCIIRHHESLASEWDFCKEVKGVRDLIKDTGLQNICGYLQRSVNHAAIYAFAERWHGETNTFHLPFGEMTITLDDVSHITGLPVVGRAFKGVLPRRMTEEYAIKLVMDGLGVSEKAIKEEIKRTKGYAVNLSWLHEHAQQNVEDPKGQQQRARAYLLWVLGCTLMSNTSGNKVSIYYLQCLEDLKLVKKYNWGAATLAFLYDQLTAISTAKKGGKTATKTIAGYLPLLEVWIYDHFRILPWVNPNFKEGQPHIAKWLTHIVPGDGTECIKAYREHLDDLCAEEVIWEPYCQKRELYPLREITWYTGSIMFYGILEAYNPERVVRQMGRIQNIPRNPAKVVKGGRKQESFLEMVASQLDQWKNHLLTEEHRGALVQYPWDCSPTYLPWYHSVSHPYVLNITERRSGPLRNVNAESINLRASISEAVKLLVEDCEEVEDIVAVLQNALGPYGKL